MQDKFDAVTYELNGRSMRLLKAYMIGPIPETAEDYIFSNNDPGELFREPKEIIDDNLMCPMKDDSAYPARLFTDFSNIENALDFSKYKLENQKLYLIFNLRASKEGPALLRLGGRHLCAKVWINGQLLFCDMLAYIDTELLICCLRPGDNPVLVELHENTASMQDKAKMFSFYACDYSKDLSNDILSSFYQREVDNKLSIIQRRWDLKDRFLDFIVLPKDFMRVQQQTICVTIKDSKEREVGRVKADFGDFIRFDTDTIPYNKNDFLFVDVDYLSEGSARSQRFIFLMNHAIEHLNHLCERIQALKPAMDRMKYVSYVRNWAEYMDKLRAGIINSRPYENLSVFIYYHDVRIIEQYLDYLENKSEHINIENAQYEFHFYRSGLDQSLIRYDLILPDNYRQDKQYPLIIYIPNAIYEDQVTYCLSRHGNAEAIAAQISCRGMTFGSYIGEAAFFECLSGLLAAYPIDKNRIYLMGSCSGAYAALLLAQAYPDLFAGLVVSNGEIDINRAMNLANVPMLNLYTELSNKMNKVYLKQMEICRACIDRYEECSFDISQDSLTYMVYNTEYLINWLLKFERRTYPKRVCFQSYYMRHHRAYGYDIRKKTDSSKPCLIEGSLSEDRLDLKLQNVARLLVMLPEKRELHINIMNEADAYTITPYKDHLEIALSDTASEAAAGVDMGLLQIYMDSLHIVIPSAFSSETEGKLIQRVAKQFAKPKSSGYEPDIYVDYPIITSRQMTEGLGKESNLILIGKAWEELPEEIKNTLPLILREDGFEYKGYHKYGKYFAMYIQPNPMNGKYILLIFANDPFLYHNIYTRKMLIPTYLNSMQSDYGNIGLLYDGSVYYCIKNTGDDIVKLTGML